MMEYVSMPLRKAIIETYDVLVRTIPSLWDIFMKKRMMTNG